MKPNDVKGTMFSEIDDEKLYAVISHFILLFHIYASFLFVFNFSFVQPNVPLFLDDNL